MATRERDRPCKSRWDSRGLHGRFFDALVSEQILMREFTNHQSRIRAPREREAVNLRREVSVILGRWRIVERR